MVLAGVNISQAAQPIKSIEFEFVATSHLKILCTFRHLVRIRKNKAYISRTHAACGAGRLEKQQKNQGIVLKIGKTTRTSTTCTRKGRVLKCDDGTVFKDNFNDASMRGKERTSIVGKAVLTATTFSYSTDFDMKGSFAFAGNSGNWHAIRNSKVKIRISGSGCTVLEHEYRERNKLDGSRSWSKLRRQNYCRVSR